MDTSERPVFPRWMAYLTVFAGIMYIEACLILFFKHGAFSQNGLMVFYLPVAVFFVWIVTLSAMTIRAVNREREALAAAERDEVRTPVAV
jgi:hypothetical protein